MFGQEGKCMLLQGKRVRGGTRNDKGEKEKQAGGGEAHQEGNYILRSRYIMNVQKRSAAVQAEQQERTSEETKKLPNTKNVLLERLFTLFVLLSRPPQPEVPRKGVPDS